MSSVYPSKILSYLKGDPYPSDAIASDAGGSRVVLGTYRDTLRSTC